MQYNSEANGQDIVTLANELCGQNDTTYPIAKKTLYANMANRQILTQIFKVYGGWKYDDKNFTDLPIATSNLVANQTIYELPDNISIDAVYIQNENDDEWTKLTRITLEDIPDAEPSYEDIPATAGRYRIIGNQIKLYPAINYSKDDAIMVEFSRDISAFLVTDTTKEPAFDSIFHEAIAVFIAYQYAQRHTLANAGELKDQWFGYIGSGGRLGTIGKHYARKFRDMFPPRMKQNYQLEEYI